MATDTEVHEEFFVDTADEDWFLWALWKHAIDTTGNGVIRIVTDGTAAIMTGGVLGVTPTAVSDFITGDFIVVEPVEEYPGTGRWQVAIARGSSNTMYYVLAPDGGWSSGDTSIANHYGFGDGATGNVITSQTASGGVIWNSTTIAATSSIRISSSNRVTYNAGDFYTFLRIHQKVVGASTDDDGTLRVGGYIPFDPVSDTKPICTLARAANMGTNAAFWGTTSTTETSNVNRTPLEYGHTSQMAAGAGRCRLIGTSFINAHVDRSNQMMGQSPVLVAMDDNKAVGVFGVLDMRVISPNDFAEFGTDAFPQGYYNHEDLLLRYAP